MGCIGTVSLHGSCTYCTAVIFMIDSLSLSFLIWPLPSLTKTATLMSRSHHHAACLTPVNQFFALLPLEIIHWLTWANPSTSWQFDHNLGKLINAMMFCFQPLPLLAIADCTLALNGHTLALNGHTSGTQQPQLGTQLSHLDIPWWMECILHSVSMATFAFDQQPTKLSHDTHLHPRRLQPSTTVPSTTEQLSMIDDRLNHSQWLMTDRTTLDDWWLTEPLSMINDRPNHSRWSMTAWTLLMIDDHSPNYRCSIEYLMMDNQTIDNWLMSDQTTWWSNYQCLMTEYSMIDDWTNYQWSTIDWIVNIRQLNTQWMMTEQLLMIKLSMFDNQILNNWWPNYWQSTTDQTINNRQPNHGQSMTNWTTLDDWWPLKLFQWLMTNQTIDHWCPTTLLMFNDWILDNGWPNDRWPIDVRPNNFWWSKNDQTINIWQPNTW